MPLDDMTPGNKENDATTGNTVGQCSYRRMISSPPGRSNVGILEERHGYTPNSPEMSARADANVWSDIRRLLSMASAGEGFILEGKNIYWSIAKVLMEDLPYHQRKLETNTEIPAYYNTTMQTVNEEIQKCREFGVKSDGTSYDHSQKAEVLMQRLLDLYEKMQKDLVVEKNGRAEFQDHDIQGILKEIKRAKSKIAGWIAIWGAMVIRKMPELIREKIKRVTEVESCHNSSPEDIASPLRRENAKIYRSEKRRRLADPDGAYFVGESEEKDLQRRQQEIDFRFFDQTAKALEQDGFPGTVLTIRSPKKGGLNLNLRALEKWANGQRKNLAMIWWTSGEYAIANGGEGILSGSRVGTFVTSPPNSSTGSLSAEEPEETRTDLSGIFSTMASR